MQVSGQLSPIKFTFLTLPTTNTSFPLIYITSHVLVYGCGFCGIFFEKIYINFVLPRSGTNEYYSIWTCLNYFCGDSLLTCWWYYHIYVWQKRSYIWISLKSTTSSFMTTKKNSYRTLQSVFLVHEDWLWRIYQSCHITPWAPFRKKNLVLILSIKPQEMSPQLVIHDWLLLFYSTPRYRMYRYSDITQSLFISSMTKKVVTSTAHVTFMSLFERGRAKHHPTSNISGWCLDFFFDLL